MKPDPQSQGVAVQAAMLWPPAAVLALNFWLLTHPVVDVQRWFEEQVILHLGYLPHGGRVEPTPIA